MAQGKISTKDEEAKIICDIIFPREAVNSQAKTLKIDVSAICENEKLQNLKTIINNAPGACAVNLIIAQNGAKKLIKLTNCVNPDKRLLDELANLIGSDKVVLD
jgi:hypothetical protein